MLFCVFSPDVPLSSNRHKVGRPKGSCKLSSKKLVEDKNLNKRRPGRPSKVRLKRLTDLDCRTLAMDIDKSVVGFHYC